MEKENKKNSRRGEGRVYQRGRIWWYEYSWRGRRFWESSKSEDVQVARNLLNDKLADIRKGKKPRKYWDLTFEDLCNLIRTNYKVKKRKSLKRLETSITHLKETFEFFCATDIEDSHVEEYILKRREEKASESSIQKETSALKKMFNLAIRKKLIREKPDIPTIEPKNVRTFFFEQEEYETLLSNLSPELKPVVVFAYWTGWRKEEILTLEWRHINFRNGEINLDPGTTKNGDPRCFPFSHNPELSTLLTEQKRRAEAISISTGKICPWVFPRKNGNRIKDYYIAFRGACKRSNLVGRRLHDFRRVTARRLEASGVGQSIAMELLGHKTPSMYDRYKIASKKDKEEAVKKMVAYQTIQNENQEKKVVQIQEVRQ